jgi:outer membrane protein assembly factor BamB
MAFIIRAIAVACVLAGVARGAAADNWPGWRGPAATGVSTETKLPETWSDQSNVAWRTSLTGVGVSSPIVWGDRVFVTSQIGSGSSSVGPRLGQGADRSDAERSLAGAARGGGVRFVVEALGAADGKRLWVHETAADGSLPPVHDKHNLASASPVTDGQRVYAVFGTGQVVAVDMAGKSVWTRHLAKEFGAWDINWGNGSSPIVYQNALILACYHGQASYLLALDAATGKQLWKVDRPRGTTSYSTPVVVPAAQGPELVVNSSVGIEAYDPATGRALWHFNEPNQFPIPVAMHHDGVI